MLDHLLRAGRAVDADHIGQVHRFEGGEGAGDVRTEEHRARRFDGHADDHGETLAGLHEGFSEARKRRLGLQQVLAGFDLHDVDPAIDQAERLFAVAVHEIIPGDVAERRELGAGANAAEAVARPFGCGKLIADGVQLAGSKRVQFTHTLRQPVFRKDNLVRAEGCTIDGVAAGGVKAALDFRQDARVRDGEIFVAAIEAAVIRDGAEAEDRGADRPGSEEHVLTQAVEKGMVERLVGHGDPPGVSGHAATRRRKGRGRGAVAVSPKRPPPGAWTFGPGQRRQRWRLA